MRCDISARLARSIEDRKAGRWSAIHRVGVALEEGGWVRYLGQGRVQILDIDGDTPTDPETESEPQQ